MIKPIRIKKVIAKDIDDKDHIMELKDILISMDEQDKAPEYDCDMSPAETLAADIVFCLAEKAGDSFTNAVDGLNIISIKQLISRLEDAGSAEAVSMLQAVFLSNGKRTDAEMLDLLDLCEDHYEGAYDDFMDSFFQTDEVDWFVTDNWMDEYREPTNGMKIVNGRLLDVEGDCSM